MHKTGKIEVFGKGLLEIVRTTLQVVLMVGILTAPLVECCGQTPLPKSPTNPEATPDRPKPSSLDVTDLKIQMAEASVKLSRSDRNLNALISALEDHLNRNCFVGLMSSLSYEGPPTDPSCIARMEQLLAINPDNPAATCLRDGIDSQACFAAYKSQQVIEFYESDSLIEDLPDPSLKVGLTAAETERVKVQYEMLSNINQQFQQAGTDAEKAKFMADAVGIYDQLLATACRVVALRVRKIVDASEQVSEPVRVAETRKKLLQVPPHLRADYQKQMRQQVEEELAQYRGGQEGKQELIKLLEVIEQPEQEKIEVLTNLQRTRIVLRPCYQGLEQAKKFIPDFPGSVCFGQGFQTPQCITAMRTWRAIKAKERKKADLKPNATPTPNNIISSF